MPSDPSFDELIRQVGNGDEQAAGRLMQDFGPIIRRVLCAPAAGRPRGKNSIPWIFVSRCSPSFSCVLPPANST